MSVDFHPLNSLHSSDLRYSCDFRIHSFPHLSQEGMDSEHSSCELSAVSLDDSDVEQEVENRRVTSGGTHLVNGGFMTGSFSAERTDSQPAKGSPDSVSDTETHSRTKESPPDCGIRETKSSSAGLCVDHKSELDWFCRLDGKLVCANCALVGSCHGHRVTPVARRAADVRNQLVDVCEKMQLQALRIENFVNKTLVAKERALHAEASVVRERVVTRVSQVREALEEEEQRLLEEVQKEQERIQHSLLTQRVHWTDALTTLTDIRTSLVHTLTHMEDSQLAVGGPEIEERVEEAEGVGEPRDSDHLNLDPGCGDSCLLQALWASTMLSGPSGPSRQTLRFDERTVSPLLSLSEDQRTLTFLPKRARQSPVYDPARFTSWPNALCTTQLSGVHCWVLEVSQSCAFKVGVCYPCMERKGSTDESRLGYNAQSWVVSLYEEEFSFCHMGHHQSLRLLQKPERVGVLLDWPGHTLLFYDPDSTTILHTVHHKFTAPLLPACAVADHSVTLQL
ncbi:hypothetical protein GJAV_G00043510 [Gymnothorax javanicus]|nr:hypothetical protein GJAV_G00043510 [Gymnothorax javanicus]